MPRRISIADEKLLPLQAFLNSISENCFLERVRLFSQGIGGGENDAICEFPSSLDPGAEAFTGVRFSLFEDEVTVDWETFLKYLSEASRYHIKAHPGDKEELERLLKASAMNAPPGTR